TNFASINTTILQPTCASLTVCHTPVGKTTSGGLDLKDDAATTRPGIQAYMALVNELAANKKAKAMKLMRVKPCDAATSFMLMKLKMTVDTDKESDVGHHMPDIAGEFLTGPQIQSIQDWISRGAIFEEPANVSGSSCQISADMDHETSEHHGERPYF